MVDTKFTLNNCQFTNKKSGDDSSDNDGYEKVQVVEYEKDVDLSDSSSGVVEEDEISDNFSG